MDYAVTSTAVSANGDPDIYTVIVVDESDAQGIAEIYLSRAKTRWPIMHGWKHHYVTLRPVLPPIMEYIESSFSK